MQNRLSPLCQPPFLKFDSPVEQGFEAAIADVNHKKIKYHIRLTATQRLKLEKLIADKKTPDLVFRNAKILLLSDEIEKNRDWTVPKIAEAAHTSPATISYLRRKFVEQGFEAVTAAKDHIQLNNWERHWLNNVIADKTNPPYLIRNANILLRLDETKLNKNWTIKKIIKTYPVSGLAVRKLRQNYIKKGLVAAIQRHKAKIRRISPKIEAKIAMLTYTNPPVGYKQWSLRLLAKKLVELGVVENIANSVVGRCLKKTKLKHNYQKAGRDNRIDRRPII